MYFSDEDLSKIGKFDLIWFTGFYITILTLGL